MAVCRDIVLIFCLLGLIACGSSKNGFDSGPIPDFGKRHKPVDDKNTLTLKNESLKLTHVTQTWKYNNVTQEQGAGKFLRLQKNFPFPIQFNGWVSLDNVEHHLVKCGDGVNVEPAFILEDDHNGAVEMTADQKINVNLEKLYSVRVEFPNNTACDGVDIQFSILYGTNE